MVTFFIQELPILTYIDLIIYSLVLSGPAQLLFNLFYSVDMLLLWVWCVVCWLEKEEGTYLPIVRSYVELPILCRSHRLHSYDPAEHLEHLHFVNLCNFKTLDGFKRSWLATATNIWNGLPADMILQGEVSGWRIVLKDMQRYTSN